MVAKQFVSIINRSAHNEEGQSLLEVVFVLPFLFLFVGLLFKLNLSVQQAINNSQYARSQIYVLTANSPEYPRLQFTQMNKTTFAQANQDMMVLGVSDPEALTDATDNNTLMPIPQIQKIGRNKSVKGSEDRGEQAKRSGIRIRNTAAICTQLNKLPNGTSDRWPFGAPVCQYKGMDGG
jgi:hypothetical protein